MSAFVVSKKCMHNAVKAIEPREGTACEDMDKIGAELYTLNCDAVNTRYSHHPERQEPPNYKYSPVSPSDVQLLKSLQCLIYQCSEGEIPERDLHKRMVEREIELLRSLCNVTQGDGTIIGYHDADWD